MGFKSNRSGKSAILTEEQLRQLNEYLPEKYSLLAEVMLWVCGRVYETSTIKVRNINFKEETIILEKESSPALASISPVLVKVLFVALSLKYDPA